MTTPTDSAFPMTASHLINSGLTKLEYFAAMAMQGYIASDPNASGETAACWAVQAAHALIAELNKEGVK